MSSDPATTPSALEAQLLVDTFFAGTGYMIAHGVEEPFRGECESFLFGQIAQVEQVLTTACIIQPACPKGSGTGHPDV